MKVIAFLFKWVVPLALFVCLCGACYLYGTAEGRSSRDPEVAGYQSKAVAAQTDLDIANGKILAYESVGNQVSQLREDLMTQVQGQQQVLMTKLQGLNVILAKKRTGNECTDARQVANDYFQQLQAQSAPVDKAVTK